MMRDAATAATELADRLRGFLEGTSDTATGEMESHLDECLAGGDVHTAVMALEQFHGGNLPIELRPYWGRLWEACAADDEREAVTAALGFLPAVERHYGAVPNADVECHVTMLQMAAIVNRNKRTIERLAAQDDFPLPAVEGGGGKPHEWKWTDVRPILVSRFGRDLPEIFPADQFVR